MRIRNIFDDCDGALAGNFHYNFIEYEKEESSEIKAQPKNIFSYKFSLNDEQRNLISRNLAVHGSDSVGVARILSRVFVKKLYRNVELIE
jgi:hypothetical protein